MDLSSDLALVPAFIRTPVHCFVQTCLSSKLILLALHV